VKDGGPTLADKKISRNDPCPCGSGKKFKHCCMGKGIDWQARRALPKLPPVPRPKAVPSPSYLEALDPFRVVDARLKEIAGATAGSADWKTQVERLAGATPAEERIETYKAVREAGVLPPDVIFFLFGNAVQLLPSEEKDLDRHTLLLYRRFGLVDMAEMYTANRLEHDRRYERGRQFFHGPPDERLAQVLREKGVID
jgi:hypothetical protein